MRPVISGKRVNFSSTQATIGNSLVTKDELKRTATLSTGFVVTSGTITAKTENRM